MCIYVRQRPYSENVERCKRNLKEVKDKVKEKRAKSPSKKKACLIPCIFTVDPVAFSALRGDWNSIQWPSWRDWLCWRLVEGHVLVLTLASVQNQSLTCCKTEPRNYDEIWLRISISEAILTHGPLLLLYNSLTFYNFMRCIIFCPKQVQVRSHGSPSWKMK